MASRKPRERGAEESINVSQLRVDLKTLVIVVSTVATVLTSYFALAAKANALNDRLTDQARQIEKLSATVEAQQRVLIELSVSARLHRAEGGER